MIGLLNHRVNHRLRQPGQVIAHFHHRQGSGDIGRSDMQQLRLLKLAQRLQLLLFILFRYAQQILPKLVAIGIGGRRLIKRIRVQ
ncbi:Uncharacterised protein [Klebsiella pneumoniae]|nr:Uncharacterised protein [Klebsiella pneumoniae]